MINSLLSIKGSLNVITGSGSGLGKATLKWFLKGGSGPILAIDRKFPEGFIDNLGLTDDQIKNIVLKTHNTFDDEVRDSLEEFTNKFGTIDNLVNVAGVALAFTLITNSGKIFNLKNAIDLNEFNTVGTFNMMRLASQFMIDKKSQESKDQMKTRCIINASCISTTKPSVGQSFYAASKSAIDSLTLCVARDLSRHNIRCNTINVGYFDTPLLSASDGLVCDYLGSEMTLCPRRLGHPDEFAHLVQSIIENQMLNGCCIKLDGCAVAAQEKPAGAPGRRHKQSVTNDH